jgi:hypothetical protein
MSAMPLIPLPCVFFNALLFFLGAGKQDSIQPGSGIGEFRLNQTLEELVADHGDPKYGDLSLGRGFAAWDIKHISADGREAIGTIKVFLRRLNGAKNYTVVQISTNSPSYRTRGGIGVSSKLWEISKIYPGLVRVRSNAGEAQTILDSGEKGIAFALNKASQCQLIVIHRPGKHLEIDGL